MKLIPSNSLILILYPVIDAPPFSGANQVIVTLLPEIAVVGLNGLPGTYAANMLSSADIIE